MRLQEDLLAFINADVSLDRSAAIVADTDLLLTALVDSLGVVEIVGWLQERSGVTIDPMDVVLENFQTVERMLALVERLLAEGAA
jgi:acyl carrier protein